MKQIMTSPKQTQAKTGFLPPKIFMYNSGGQTFLVQLFCSGKILDSVEVMKLLTTDIEKKIQNCGRIETDRNEKSRVFNCLL